MWYHRLPCHSQCWNASERVTRCRIVYSSCASINVDGFCHTHWFSIGYEKELFRLIIGGVVLMLFVNIHCHICSATQKERRMSHFMPNQHPPLGTTNHSHLATTIIRSVLLKVSTWYKPCLPSLGPHICPIKEHPKGSHTPAREAVQITRQRRFGDGSSPDSVPPICPTSI